MGKIFHFPLLVSWDNDRRSRRQPSPITPPIFNSWCRVFLKDLNLTVKCIPNVLVSPLSSRATGKQLYQSVFLVGISLHRNTFKNCTFLLILRVILSATLHKHMEPDGTRIYTNNFLQHLLEVSLLRNIMQMHLSE